MSINDEDQTKMSTTTKRQRGSPHPNEANQIERVDHNQIQPRAQANPARNSMLP
jgi:hypothetical protein